MKSIRGQWTYILLSSPEDMEPQWVKHYINQELLQNFGILNSAHIDILKWKGNQGIIRVLDKIPSTLVFSKFHLQDKSHCLSSLLISPFQAI